MPHGQRWLYLKGSTWFGFCYIMYATDRRAGLKELASLLDLVGKELERGGEMVLVDSAL